MTCVFLWGHNAGNRNEKSPQARVISVMAYPEWCVASHLPRYYPKYVYMLAGPSGRAV